MKTRWITYLTVVVYVGALVVFLGLSLSRTGEVVTRDSQYEITHVSIAAPGLGAALGSGAWVAALALFLLGIVAICRRRVRFGGITIFIAVCGYIAAHIVCFLSNPGPWMIMDKIIGPDAQAYYFLDSSFLQGQTMAIARLDSKGVLRRTFEVLGTNNGDSPRSYASVIRPAGVSTDHPRQLYVSQSGRVLGFRAHKCFLAYDTDSGRFFGHGDVEDLSPFMLMDSRTTMHQPDVAAAMERIRLHVEFVTTIEDIRHAGSYLAGDTCPGYPKQEALMVGLSHANPEVRRVAGELLDVHRAGVVKVTERIAKSVENLVEKLGSKNSLVQVDAAEALGGIGAPGAEAAIPALVQAARDEDADVRLQAAQSLGLIGERAVPALIQLLKDEDDSIRANALFGLNMAESEAKIAIPDLVEMLKSKEQRLRAKAVQALGNIGPEAAIAIPMIEKLLDDEDSSVRFCAAKALGRIRP